MVKFSGKTTEKLMKYWLDLPGQPNLPNRSDIDPVSIGTKILPHIFLCSVQLDPFEVYFRLQGTFINDLLGQNFKGKKVGPETFGDDADDILELYKRVSEDQRPILSRELIKSAMGTERLIEVIHLPLAGERKDGNVQFILGAIDVLNWDRSQSETFVSRHWVIQTTNALDFQ